MRFYLCWVLTVAEAELCVALNCFTGIEKRPVKISKQTASETMRLAQDTLEMAALSWMCSSQMGVMKASLCQLWLLSDLERPIFPSCQLYEAYQERIAIAVYCP